MVMKTVLALVGGSGVARGASRRARRAAAIGSIFDGMRGRLHPVHRCALATVTFVAISLIAPALAGASSTPGTLPAALPSDALNASAKLAASPRNGDPLLPFLTESGDISLSVDGIATNDAEGAPVKVYKEFANETVRKAYLFAASTGETDFNPEGGEVTLDGTPIEWNSANTISNDINSINAEAEVTSLVKEQLNAAPAGDSEFTIAEGDSTYDMDGEILAVIFNNPNVIEPNSVTLLYGAQNPDGDSFNIGLAEPVDKSNPSFALNLSLGISYGYQQQEVTEQFSIIHANGKLMTQMAGGQDDCAKKYEATPEFASCGNGELLTVGGIGDSTEDPNANETLAECAAENGEPVARCDDELYSLLPFVENGETEVNFETDNPSDDDNIFFGAVETHANEAVVGEGVTLAPTTGTNTVGETHTLTATVRDDEGEPLGEVPVTFRVSEGPNAGATGEATTDEAGQASWSYSSSKSGTDEIVASFTSTPEEPPLEDARAAAAAQAVTYESNLASETWVESHPATKEEPKQEESKAATTASAPPAKGAVLAFGTAHLASSGKACTAGSSYVAAVSGKDIASVTYVLNGHKLKTLTKAKHGKYSLAVPVKAGKVEHLTIHVAFTAAASNKTQTIHKTLAKCAAVHHASKPRFTG